MNKHVKRIVIGGPLVAIGSVAVASVIWVANQIGATAILIASTIPALLALLSYSVGGLIESIRDRP